MADQENPSTAQSKLQADLAALREELGKIRTDFGGVIAAMSDASKSGAGEAREKVDLGVEKLREGLDAAKDRGAQVLESATKKIQERPLTAILVALGVGLVIGKMLDRRGE